MKGWENSGNSCYMDVIIFSLFYRPTEFIKKYILKDDDDVERNRLRDIFRRIKNTDNCGEMKRWIRENYNEDYPKFYNNNQHEALEFMQYIFSIFGLNGLKSVGTVIEYNKRYGVKTQKDIRWHEWNKIIDRRASNIYVIPYLDLKKPNRNLIKYLENKIMTYPIEAKYKKCFINCSEEMNKIIKMSSIMIFGLQRENPITKKVIHYKVKIPEKIGQLELYGAVLHLGSSINYGHYILIMKIKDEWYLYDDLNKDGDFEKISIKKYKDRIEKMGVIFFYEIKK